MTAVKEVKKRRLPKLPDGAKNLARKIMDL